MSGIDPKDLWDDEVDVAEWTARDFESRRRSLAIWDTDRYYRNLATEFGDVWEMGRNAAADRAIRIYIAYILDNEDTLDLRVESNQTVLIPPEGWVDENRDEWVIPTELPEPEPVEQEGKEQFKPSTAETVSEIESVLVDEYDFHENISEFNRSAIRFVARLDDDEK